MNGTRKPIKIRTAPSVSFNFLACAAAEAGKTIKRKYIPSPQPVPDNLTVVRAEILNKDQ